MRCRALALIVVLCAAAAAAAADSTQQAASTAADYLVAPGAQGHPSASQGGGQWRLVQDAAATAGREDLITLETTHSTVTELALEPHADGEDYATMDETARWIVTSSDELLGDESTNTPFEVALVETEDDGAVAQVLGAPDLDASWLAYEMVHDIPHIPDWEAISEGEAWYRSLEMEPDALLEAINAAVVFAAGLFVGVLLGGRMNARSGTSAAAAACTACGRPGAQQMGPGGVPGVALEDEAPPVLLVSVVRA